MLTDREIVAAMQEANPFPEPELLLEDLAGFDILLDKISERRVPMLSTPEIRTEELEAMPSPTLSWNRRPLVVLASFIVMLMAVGIGAVIFRGGGSDTATPATELTTPSTIPSSPTLPPTTAAPDATPSTLAPISGLTPGVFVTYGPEEGVPDGCAYSIAFAGTDVYLAGECGLMHFDGTDWYHLAELSYPNFLLDLAVAPDGTVWISNIDSDVLQWTGQQLVEYDLRASGIEVTPDGTVWAVQYARWEDAAAEIDKVEALRRLSGSEWVLENEAVENGIGGLAIDPDGTLWAVETQWRVVGGNNMAYSVLNSYDGASWTAHDTPEFAHIEGVAADGSIMLRTIDGAFAALNGDSWTTYEAPTLDELGIPAVVDPVMNDLINHLGLTEPTITEDGTLWAHSFNGYGAFSFDGNEWTRYTTEDGLASNGLLFIEVGPDGSLWFGTEDAGVTRYLPEQ